MLFCGNPDSGTLTQKSPRCLQVGDGFSGVITGCAFKRCLQSCSLASGLLFELVHSRGHVVPGSFFEETGTSLIQLPHNAIKFGKEVRRSEQSGLEPLQQYQLLANDKSLGKLFCSQLEAEDVPIGLASAATDLREKPLSTRAASAWRKVSSTILPGALERS